jgi:uncharacterized membrane protein YcaP (DUF421 family)
VVEIVIRALVVFLFLWLVTRVVGRATLGELSTFELLLYITMGDLVQQAVTQQDYSVTSAFLAVGVFTLLTVALSWTAWRWPATQPLIKGVPVVIIQAGELRTDAMRRHRLSFDDLTAAARQQGIRRISQIDTAVLETDGRISFFVPEATESGSPESPAVG